MAEHERDPVEELFHKLIAASPEERVQILDAIDNPELRARLEALLRQDARRLPEDGFFGGFGAAMMSALDHDALANPEEIGPYRVRREIGRGAFGVVYEAEEPSAAHRLVAVKVIKLGLDSVEVLARFEQEREILRLMDHPNIAKVFDAGTTAGGRPYFAMQLVQGDPITEYCDKHTLNNAERIGLFTKLCNAVHHAHQKGVIHRDLKPSNVLVSVGEQGPEPVIIDFGIARATQRRLTEWSVFTQFGQLVGTPGYMSPEQAEMSGVNVDTRTDVYSLGVMLYELLIGSRPFDDHFLRQVAWDQIIRIIRETDPDRPSTKLSSLGDGVEEAARRRRTDPRMLTRELEGDLDWIVMKCLDKDRLRRYDSAKHLAEDLQRHLWDQPVLARPASPAYQLRKWSRRNRRGLRIAGPSIAAVLLAVGATGWFWIDAAKAELGRHELVRGAIAVVDTYLRQVQEKLAELPASTARILLAESAVSFMSTLLQQPDYTKNAEVLKRLAMGYETLGECLGGKRGGSLGDRERAAEMYRKALSIWEEIVMRVPDDVEVRRRLAYAPVRQADLANSSAEAIPLLTSAINQLEILLASHPADYGITRYLAIARASRGWWLKSDGDREEALRNYDSARSLFASLPRQTGDEARRLRDDAVAIVDLGEAYEDLGRRADAREAFETSLRLRRDLLDSAGKESSRAQRDVMQALIRIAKLDVKDGRLDDAERVYRDALVIAEPLRLADHPDRRALLDLAEIHNRLGNLLALSPNRRPDARTEFEAAFRDLQGELQSQPLDMQTPEFLNQYGIAAYALGQLAQGMQAWPLMEESLKASLLAYFQLAKITNRPDFRRRGAKSAMWLGQAQRNQAKLAEATESFAAASEAFVLLGDCSAARDAADNAIGILESGQESPERTVVALQALKDTVLQCRQASSADTEENDP